MNRVFVLLLLTACGSSTRYAANTVPSEITLQYRDGLIANAGNARVAESPAWLGLEAHVGCVERARYHADRAETNGAVASVTRWFGFGLGAASFGGLAGAAADSEHWKYWLGAGVGAAVTGLIMAAIASSTRASADGNAVDAINYYNDELGVRGLTCANPHEAPPPVTPTGVAPLKDIATSTRTELR